MHTSRPIAKGPIKFEDLGEPLRKLLKETKGHGEEELKMLQWLSVKDVAKVYEKQAEGVGAELIWSELKKILMTRKEKLNQDAKTAAEMRMGLVERVEEGAGQPELFDQAQVPHRVASAMEKKLAEQPVQDKAQARLQLGSEDKLEAVTAQLNARQKSQTGVQREQKSCDGSMVQTSAVAAEVFARQPEQLAEEVAGQPEYLPKEQVISVEALATEFGEFAEEDVYGSDNDHDDLTSRQHSETTVSMASCLGARSETMTSTASSIGPRSETTASIGSSLNLRSETMASIASTRSPPFENAASLDSCLASRETIVSTGSFFRPPLDITASLGSPLSPRALTMPLMGSSLTERSKSLQMLIRGYSARDHDYKKPGLSKCGQMTASILNMLAQVESTKRRAIMDREAAEYAVFLLDTKFKELGHECCGRRKLIGDKEDRERLALLEWFARAQIQAEEAAAERLILCSRMALLDLDMTDLAIHFGWEKIEIAEIEAQRRLSEVESRATAELSKNFRFLTKYFRNSMGKFNAQSCQRV